VENKRLSINGANKSHVRILVGIKLENKVKGMKKHSH
jgi:hypothetical protein